ncbi:hypothetical protein [aff. Roholtiella sp. LEGE 12411]|uniref:hypothetical protein n=1 Tax=aff. Roholtiella sp. LEGE 12411 TaxID=1828822 RepID=UPI001882CBB9|nr:hypothetical protein [aff. Roholtiella sp. LEGE 12411]MBE9035132.1 hypothetical protein [aff. Roholtiella sp. LEGE 12411]
MGTQSCFLTLVAAHLEAAVCCRHESGAPPVIEVRVYRSGGVTVSPSTKEEPTLIIFDPG